MSEVKNKKTINPLTAAVKWLKEKLIGKPNLALVGQTFIAPEVINDNAKKVTFDLVLKGHYSLLAFNRNPVDAVASQQLEYLAKMKYQFINITPQKNKFLADARFSKNIYDKNKELEYWFSQNRVKYVIIKPDRTIIELCNDTYQLNVAIYKMIKKQTLVIEK